MDFIDFINDYVDVGIKHDVLKHRPFFFKGVLKKVTDEYLELKLEDGFKLIPLLDVIEIRRLSR